MLQPAGLAKGDCVSIHKVYRDIGKARQLGSAQGAQVGAGLGAGLGVLGAQAERWGTQAAGAHRRWGGGPGERQAQACRQARRALGAHLLGEQA